MRRFAIITGGGMGVRMNEAVPKQFLPLGKIPMIMRTMKHFVSFCENIIVSLPEDYFDYWADLQKKYNFSVPHTLVAGGEMRFDSVSNAMEHLPDEGLVAVHDAVRPFISRMLIIKCFNSAERWGNAVAALPVTESLRTGNKNSNESVDREQFYRIQTPQVFQCKEIKAAYRQPYREIFTDDASVLEAMGGTIYLVDGEEWNIKITTSMDMFLAENLIKYKK